MDGLFSYQRLAAAAAAAAAITPPRRPGPRVNTPATRKHYFVKYFHNIFFVQWSNFFHSVLYTELNTTAVKQYAIYKIQRCLEFFIEKECDDM